MNKIENKLDPDIYSNKTQYFFTLLGPRFDLAVLQMQKSLEKQFHTKFKAIYVYSSSLNNYFRKDNYIILNEKASRIEKNLKNKVIYLPEYEDINAEFSKSKFISKISNNLFKKQKKIFVYPFTSSFLNLNNQLKIIAPDTKITTHYDNKISQCKLFKKLELPTNNFQIFKSVNELKKNWKKIIPCYLTASYSSGGNESNLIFTKEMLEEFLTGLRDINVRESFLSAAIFKNISLAPNINAIVIDKNNTKPLIITDQILRGNRYLGNIYPSKSSKLIQKQIIKITTKLGNYLSRKGYRGLFGCDFLVNKKGEIVIVDLNPRRQGGYVCNIAALNKVGINLTDLELKTYLNIPVTENLDYNKIQYPNFWAHSKVKPYEAGGIISSEVSSGNIQNIFKKGKGDYSSSFYAKNSMFIDGYIGYVVSVDDSYEKVFNKVILDSNKVLGKTLFL
jgi:predicted ATP-grasp superfamily ATP-dependent carboligase